jgi:hypothetical protein
MRHRRKRLDRNNFGQRTRRSDPSDGAVAARREESVGVGLSRLSPAEHGVAGIGRELAAARALSDLARRMMAATAHDMEGLTAAPAASPN